MFEKCPINRYSNNNGTSFHYLCSKPEGIKCPDVFPCEHLGHNKNRPEIVTNYIDKTLREIRYEKISNFIDKHSGKK
ncbi:MAG: hypothetical protein KAT37_02205 [Candidatus Aenigmarchaeota archaeon]|nr:hypothetical protein [Candidatus Aenigmarchaeota archaeon]